MPCKITEDHRQWIRKKKKRKKKLHVVRKDIIRRKRGKLSIESQWKEKRRGRIGES
jgi:hypothetical protein